MLPLSVPYRVFSVHNIQLVTTTAAAAAIAEKQTANGQSCNGKRPGTIKIDSAISLTENDQSRGDAGLRRASGLRATTTLVGHILEYRTQPSSLSIDDLPLDNDHPSSLVSWHSHLPHISLVPLWSLRPTRSLLSLFDTHFACRAAINPAPSIIDPLTTGF